EGLIGGQAGDRLSGNAEANVLSGLGGADILNGRAGNDALLGGDGHDMLIGGAGADLLDGGAGIDRVSYEGSGAVVASFANPSANTGDAAGDGYVNVEGLIGSSFADVLVGNNFANILLGEDGNDYLEGHAGSDAIAGGSGNDQIEGGAGADIVDGGFHGFDYARYFYAPSAVTVDLVNAAANTGEAQGDTLISIEGLFGSRFNDRLLANDLGNNVGGQDGDDLIDGRGGNDGLLGDGGNDTLLGGAGDDKLIGGAGGDVLNGGAGYDLATYAAAAIGVVASIQSPAANTGEAAGDTFVSIEAFIGSAFNDTLVMDAAHNTIEGLSGNDYLRGKGGNDVLRGGDGIDFLEGGAGADGLVGGAGFDYASYVDALAGLTADLGTPALNTGDAVGDSYRDIEGLIGSRFADILTGNASGNDMGGGDDNDRLNGFTGNDGLQGGNGDDTIVGGLGADLLAGGPGNDEFAFFSGEAQGDTAIDFNGAGAAAGDRLTFQGYGTAAQGATFVQLDATHWQVNSFDGSVRETITFATPRRSIRAITPSCSTGS
ncbi:MAG TPA: calcium-binding protein, partial [Burkholderiales bacterium]|nr:calcium-binding protein [Burkholderiales bacterium]